MVNGLQFENGKEGLGLKAENLVRDRLAAGLRALRVTLLCAGFLGGFTCAAFAVALPRTLSASDSQAYNQIFTLQAQAQMGGVSRLIGQLTDERLLGHVLAQRYLHPTAYRSSYTELRRWLEAYTDYPQAEKIYALALRKRADAEPLPRRPVILRGRSASPQENVKTYRSHAPRSKASLQQIALIRLHLKGLLGKSGADAALAYLNRDDVARRLDAVETDMALQKVAASYFQNGRDQDALRLAGEAARRSGKIVPAAHWTAGLAAWRLGHVDQASAHFSAMADANSPYTDQASRTAAAYWAARAHLAARRPQKVNHYLQAAAKHPQTLYGMLAHRQLGIDLPFDWNMPELSQSDMDILQRQPGFLRALALKEAGQTALADKEVQLLHDKLGPKNDTRLLALAAALKLPQSQIKIAQTERAHGKTWLAGLYPVPEWRPQGGFTLDPALLFAIIRRESNFSALAEGGGGARGLMQLMPETARFISHDQSLRGVGRNRLFDPEFNLSLGQSYVRHLQKSGSGDLFSLIASYNAGPVAIENWRRQAKTKDPLFFLESLPSADTRDYVEHVLADFWIYQHRMGAPGISLDAVAEGNWPQLTPPGAIGAM